MLRNKVNISPQCPCGHPIGVNSAGLIDISLIHYSEWHISTHAHHFDIKSMTCAKIDEFPQSWYKLTAMQTVYF
jgi:hypothetical protein